MSQEKNQNIEVLWTPAQLAKYLTLSPFTVRRWIKDGKIGNVVRIGRSLRIPRSEVERIAAVISGGLKEE